MFGHRRHLRREDFQKSRDGFDVDGQLDSIALVVQQLPVNVEINSNVTKSSRRR